MVRMKFTFAAMRMHQETCKKVSKSIKEKGVNEK